MRNDVGVGIKSKWGGSRWHEEQKRGDGWEEEWAKKREVEVGDEKGGEVREEVEEW